MGSIKEILSDNIAPERPRSLAEQSADKLRELILFEKLPPGLPVNERDLSDVLGVSRTPIRDAIKILEVEGLIDYSETRRPRVADPDIETLSQWLIIQGALEGLAGEQACIHASNEELKDIAAIQSQMVDFAESDDRMRLFTLDMEFHNAIVKAAHLPALVETHNLYNSRLWRARFISSQRRANRHQQMMKHQAIVDALLDRDGQAASKALTTHLRNAISNIKAARAEQR